MSVLRAEVEALEQRTLMSSAPTAANDTFTLAAGAPATLPVLGNDAANLAGGQLAVVSAGGAAHGTVSVAPGGTGVVYTPNAGSSGPDSFTYTVSNSIHLARVPRQQIGSVGGVPVFDGFGSAMAPVPGTTDEFYVMTDRGPNTDGPNGSKVFPVPDFTPQIGRYKLADGQLTLVKTILLRDANGRPRTGLPTPPGSAGATNETALDTAGNTLAPDPNGLDSEGLVALPDGTFWVSDEYGPFLTHFDVNGKTIEQISPNAPNAQGHQLPQVLAKRRVNRGMEGLTITPDGKTLVGMMQSPLNNDISGSDNGTTAALRIVTYDLASGATKQYLYLLENPATFGGSVSEITAVSNTEFLVDERDGNFPGDPAAPSALKRVYDISIANATDVSKAVGAGDTVDPAKGLLIGGTTTIEKLVRNLNTADAAAALAAKGITPVTKTLKVDLLAELNRLGPAGSIYGHDKVEGVSLINGGRTLVLSNDDDFGIADTNPISLNIAPETLPVQGVVDYTDLLFIDLQNLPAQPATATVNVTVDSLPNGVAAGDVNQTSAVLWTHSLIPGIVTFEYSTDPNFGTVVGSLHKTVTDPLQPVKVQATGLTPNTRYYYRATDASGDTAAGTFKTAAAAGTQTGLHFGISGDWRGELAPYPSVSNADDANLDFFVEFGDTIYADFPSPDVPKAQATTLEDFRRKNNEVYSTRFGLNTLKDLRQSTPVLAVIDDHEVTDNFAGGAAPSSDPRFAGQPGQLINDTPLFNNGLTAFQEYNPIRDEFYGNTADPVTANQRKLYRFNTYGTDAAVFTLDARSFRSAELSSPNPTDPASAAQFLGKSFDPSRTLLGKAQLAELEQNLLDAEAAGITWKFILTPEPIQNFGVLAAEDRYEGYAAERTALLKFIDDHHISNALFVTADFHGTVTNRLSYQLGPGQPQVQTNSIEVITGPVAFDKPFGLTIVDLAAQLHLITPQQQAFYNGLPPGSDAREQFVLSIVNPGLAALGYNPLSLKADPLPNVHLVQGNYLATDSYGWTEFTVDPVTQRVDVKTWGIDPYSQAELNANPAAVTARTPRVVSEFTVDPLPPFRPQVTINNGMAEEGDEFTSTLNFPVRLSAPSSRPITIAYSTRDGTATSPSDYQAAVGTLTFNPGETIGVIGIPVNGDRTVEPDETLTVTLSETADARVAGNGTAVGTILNDDRPPAPRVFIIASGMSVREGNNGTTALTFTISLSGPATAPVTVKYATQDGTAKSSGGGADYIAAKGTLTFKPGQTQKTVTVLVKGDRTKEADETLLLKLSGAINAAIGGGVATGVIRNDD